MNLEGTLDAFGLPDVVALLAGTGKTGGLQLRHAQGPGLVHGVVWFREGRISGASSDRSRASLVRRVVGSGAVDDAALRHAVQRATGGGTGVARALLGRVQHLPGAAGIVAAPATPALTPRLEQVARLWCEAGLGAREIAEELHLREQTVRGYIKQIYQVLGVAEDGPAANPRQRAYEVRAEGEPGEG